MSKSNARNAAKTQTAAVTAFNVAQWRTDLTSAATQFASGAKQLLTLAIAARGLVEEDTAREAFKDAFAAALSVTMGVTDEEARSSKSLANRVSDAMAVFKCETLPAILPQNLQQAADTVRKANPNKKARAPRAGGKPEAVATVDAKHVNPLALLESALAALKLQAGDNQTALELVGELVDLAQDLAQVLAAEVEEAKAA
jgi:hypothetical protein